MSEGKVFEWSGLRWLIFVGKSFVSRLSESIEGRLACSSNNWSVIFLKVLGVSVGEVGADSFKLLTWFKEKVNLVNEERKKERKKEREREREREKPLKAQIWMREKWILYRILI